ncbi:MAG: glutamate synthase-related protein, partial [Sulfolobaceae archaeon]
GKGAITWSQDYKPFTYVYLPSSSEAIEEVMELKGVLGFIFDEDIGNEDLEIVISQVDTKLKEMGVRKKFDLIAKSSRIRDSGDVFKFVALGADSVIMTHKVLDVAIGEGSRSGLKDKAFNLIAGFKKEIALLAGAAGIYSVQSSLTGNRELLRAVNLNSYVLKKLRVKVAGSL